jgi:HK97 family phage portal protein
MGLFSRKVETRDSQFIVPSELTRDGSYADITVTPDTALRLSAVWACVRLLADTVSTLPLDTFRGDEEITAPPLLTSPAAGWSLPEWLYAAMVSLLLRGNAWGLITARSGPRLTPAQVELVNPDNVTVNVEANGSITYRYKGRVIDPGDLWHVRAFVYPGSPVGLSPVSYAMETIGLSLAVQRFGREFFNSGASPSGILSVNAPLSSEKIEEVKFRISAATHGKREPLVVGSSGATGDPITWTSLSINPNESQFIESRKLGVAEIARTFGVPPEMIGGEAGNSLTYATVEGRALDFLRYSLQPWLVRLETAIGELLPRGQTVKFNANALLRGTTLERYQAHEIALASGWLTVEEVRALEDLGPMPAATSPPNLQAVEGTGS